MKFYVDEKKIRQSLLKIEATIIQSNILMKRWTFTSRNQPEQWVRVRDEGGRITLTLKQFNGNNDINSVQEVEIEVSDFNGAYQIFSHLNFDYKRYVENYRETWFIDNCYVMIDHYPGLDLFIEIEGPSEMAVRALCKKLKISINNAMYGPTALLYRKKYNISREEFDQIEELTFDTIDKYLS